MVKAAAIATQRNGRIRLRTRSESCPAPIRPIAPRNWVPATSSPAVPAAHPRSATSQTNMKVHTVNWGTTNSTDTACTRQRNELPRYGLRSCPA